MLSVLSLFLVLFFFFCALFMFFSVIFRCFKLFSLSYLRLLLVLAIYFTISYSFESLFTNRTVTSFTLSNFILIEYVPFCNSIFSSLGFFHLFTALLLSVLLFSTSFLYFLLSFILFCPLLRHFLLFLLLFLHAFLSKSDLSNVCCLREADKSLNNENQVMKSSIECVPNICITLYKVTHCSCISVVCMWLICSCTSVVVKLYEKGEGLKK